MHGKFQEFNINFKDIFDLPTDNTIGEYINGNVYFSGGGSGGNIISNSGYGGGGNYTRKDGLANSGGGGAGGNGNGGSGLVIIKERKNVSENFNLTHDLKYNNYHLLTDHVKQPSDNILIFNYSEFKDNGQGQT